MLLTKVSFIILILLFSVMFMLHLVFIHVNLRT